MMLTEQGNCASQSKLHRLPPRPIGIAAGDAKQILPHPLPPWELTQRGRGRYLREEGRHGSSTEVLIESRRGNPAKSLTLGNTGFARSLADMRGLTANRRFSVTGRQM